MYYTFCSLLAAILLLPMLQPLAPVAPVWLGSTLYQTASLAITVPAGKSGTTSFTFLKAFDSSNGGGVQMVVVGYQSMTQSSPTTSLSTKLAVSSNSSTGASVSYAIGNVSYISSLNVRYLAIAASVTAITTFNNLNILTTCNCYQVSSGSGSRVSTLNVNFTKSTKMTLDLNHANQMIIFVQTIEATTTNGIFKFSTSVRFTNVSFYQVNLTAEGNTQIKTFIYSRMIFDQTTIQSSQTMYLDAGILLATNSNYSQLGTSFYYLNTSSFMMGLTYFSIPSTSLLNWSFDVNTISTMGTLTFN